MVRIVLGVLPSAVRQGWFRQDSWVPLIKGMEARIPENWGVL